MKNLFKVLAIFFSLVFSQISLAEIVFSTQSGSLKGSFTGGSFTENSAFNDYWIFHLNQNSNVIGTVANDNLRGTLGESYEKVDIFNINNLNISLFRASLGTTVENSRIYSLIVGDLNPSSNNFLFHNLTSGDYAVGISGIANGKSGGKYNGELTISAVPEPKEWAMMILSLPLMGFVSARRKKSV